MEWSDGITSHLDVKFTAKTITVCYCVKDKDDVGGMGLEWPEGSYCIAQKDNDCPQPGFGEGSITWNDYKSLVTRKSLNKITGKLPHGVYDKNTKIYFCCRSDGKASDSMILPIAKPFVLYRYHGKCQNVNGTTVNEDFIKYDDNSRSRIGNKNGCEVEHPDDDNCKGDHKLYFCHYKKA